MGDARTSGGQPPGSRSLAFGEDEKKGKKPKGFACRSSTAAASVQHRARAPLTARLTCEQASASEIWGQPAGFGDGRAESLVPGAA